MFNVVIDISYLFIYLLSYFFIYLAEINETQATGKYMPKTRRG